MPSGNLSERQKSDRREEWLAKELGGKRVSGSGSSKEKKGDNRFTHALLEDKRTAAKSISIQSSWLEKIEQEALNCGKLPVFSFGFDGRVPEEWDNTWVSFPIWWLKDQEWWKELAKK